MQNKDLLILNQNAGKLSNLKGLKMTYAIVKNLKKIGREIEILKESQPAEFKEFEVKRIALVESMATKDADGKPVIINNNYQIDNTNTEEFTAKLKVLQEEYKDTISEYDKFLDNETNIQFYKIKLEDIPSEVTIQQMLILDNWIKEEISCE